MNESLETRAQEAEIFLKVIQSAGRMDAYDLAKKIFGSPDNWPQVYKTLCILEAQGKLLRVNDQGFGSGNEHLIDFAYRYRDGDKA